MARWYDDEDDWGGNRHHVACPCGCGELSDECAGPRPAPLGSMRVVKPVKVVDVYSDEAWQAAMYDADAGTATCRWHKPCSQPASRGGYCDDHLGTL